MFNPSATVAGLSQYLWKLEQPAHAVANGYFMACSNRVGTEAPWNIGRFYGSSYFVDPRGNFLAVGSEDKTELVVAEMDLDVIEEVRARVAVLSRSPAGLLRRDGGAAAVSTLLIKNGTIVTLRALNMTMPALPLGPPLRAARHSVTPSRFGTSASRMMRS